MEFAIGTIIKWETFDCDKYEGQIIEDDGDCYIVRLTDGRTRTVSK